LHEETAKQSTSNGVTFVEHLKSKGIVPGIKVDKGLAELNNHHKEKYTKGLDALPAMTKEFYALGCRFAKWRAVFQI
jgi:fructose-bisphosphate aldolase class I